MDFFRSYNKWQSEGLCFYCGGIASTMDHIPSKILLDKPFPDNLHAVPCCLACNNSFSLDEEYVGCLFECIICNTCNVEELNRPNIQKILKRKPALLSRIKSELNFENNAIGINPDINRVKAVLTKCAKGHIHYEYTEFLCDDEPSVFKLRLLSNMTEEERSIFFETNKIEIFPEIGSRASQNYFVISNGLISSCWFDVQKENYSFMISNNPYSVKMLIQNQIAIEFIW